VTPLRQTSLLAASPTHSFALTAYGTARATAGELGGLRSRLRPPGGEPLSVASLKHADEQAVVALAAVFQALERAGLTVGRFAGWGVLAAPRFLGRAALAAAMQRFAQEGAWGVSPHLIPQRSLHSLSGIVSQALGLRGPNFGVGGGPRGEAQALLVAAGLLAHGELPGLWVVLTGWDPELAVELPECPESASSNGQAPACGAVALALAPDAEHRGGPRVELDPTGSPGAAGHPAVKIPELSGEHLRRVLEGDAGLSVVWRLGRRGWLRLDRRHSSGATLP
jgi:hypothetical protein